MNTEDLTEHIARVRMDLEIKKAGLDRLFLTDPETAMRVRYQIDCLEPRLAELERGARRAASERAAHLDADRVLI